MMRSYLTRHGNGPLPQETKDFFYEDLTNKSHPFQGDFRFAYHSSSLMEHSFRLNMDLFQDIGLIFKKGHQAFVCVSCLDQSEGKIWMDGKGITYEDFKNLPIWSRQGNKNPLLFLRSFKAGYFVQ
jgi:adenylosuccinate synthase